MIDDLIQRIAAHVGIEAGTAEKALGLVLAFLKKDGDSDLIGELFSKMQGADELADAHARPSGGGLFGGLASAAGGLLGGKAGGAMEALAMFRQSGVSVDDAKAMFPLVAEYAREQAGDDLVRRALTSSPTLRSFFERD